MDFSATRTCSTREATAASACSTSTIDMTPALALARLLASSSCAAFSAASATFKFSFENTTSQYVCSTVARTVRTRRSEEHTSELQSHVNIVCRLLLEKNKVI